MKSKIIDDQQKLISLMEKYRRAKKKIVLTQGSFDMIHVGHGRYLEQAKTQGDVLIVGVDSDEKVRFRKGPGRPVVPQDERLEMLTYLSTVDHVVLKNLSDPKFNLIKMIHPDVLVATKETYTIPAKIRAVKKLCGQLVILEPQATTSTSAKIRRVQIGATKKIESALTKKLLSAIEEVLTEFKE